MSKQLQQEAKQDVATNSKDMKAHIQSKFHDASMDAKASAKAAVNEAEKASGKSKDPHELAVHDKKEKDVKKTTEEATKPKDTGEAIARDAGTHTLKNSLPTADKNTAHAAPKTDAARTAKDVAASTATSMSTDTGKTLDTLAKARDQVTDTARAAKDSLDASKAKDDTTHTHKAAETLPEKQHTMTDTVKETAIAAKDTVKDTAIAAKDKTIDVATAVRDKAMETGHNVVEAGETTLEKAGELGSRAAHAVADAATTAVHKAEDVASSAYQGAKSAVSTTTGLVSTGFEKTVQALSNLSMNVAHGVESAVETVREVLTGEHPDAHPETRKVEPEAHPASDTMPVRHAATQTTGATTTDTAHVHDEDRGLIGDMLGTKAAATTTNTNAAKPDVTAKADKGAATTKDTGKDNTGHRKTNAAPHVPHENANAHKATTNATTQKHTQADKSDMKTQDVNVNTQ